MRVSQFEAMVRQNGFERAAMHFISSLIEENNAINSNFRQLDEYLQQKDKVIEGLVQAMTGMKAGLDYIGKDQYGSELRLRQLSMGVKVDSEAVQEAEASGKNASGN